MVDTRYKKGHIPWLKGKHLSEETKRRLSEIHKGKPAWNKGISPSKETIKKQRETLMKTFSNPEVRKKMSERQKRLWTNPEYRKNQEEKHKGLHLSPKTEFKKGASSWMKGKHHSEEAIRKMNEALKRRMSNPEARKKTFNALLKMQSNPEIIAKRIANQRKSWANSEIKSRFSKAQKKRFETSDVWNKGKTGIYSAETLKKLSEAFKGEKSNFWRGGISFEPYSVDWTRALRKIVRERDNHTCQICFNKGNQVHHIDYDKKNCNPENLITLCRSCHTKTNQNREKWKKFFEEVSQFLNIFKVKIIK